jgi:hypothetical protein
MIDLVIRAAIGAAIGVVVLDPTPSGSAPTGSAPASPAPSTGGNGGGGFDWNKIKPDPTAVPKADLFYTIVNACMFLGVVAAIAGLVAGAIAFGVGPVFGAHIISDRGKSMMWKAGLVAIIVGSATTIIGFLLKQ